MAFKLKPEMPKIVDQEINGRKWVLVEGRVCVKALSPDRASYAQGTYQGETHV